MNYICAKCGVSMEEVDDIAVAYNGMDLPSATGLRCPQCGINFLEEQMVIEQVNTAEMMLESK
jgi:DNA-directed RNA polymerase subunit RPC12/RpoP